MQKLTAKILAINVLTSLVINTFTIEQSGVQGKQHPLPKKVKKTRNLGQNPT